MKTVIEQLNDVYFNIETWHKHKETNVAISSYHQEMIDRGNLCCYVEDGELLSYFECLFINPEQMEKIINTDDFCGPEEDTTHGNIAYLYNLWIKNDERKFRVMRSMKKLFFEKTKHCVGWVGMETKRNNRLRIFRKRS